MPGRLTVSPPVVRSDRVALAQAVRDQSYAVASAILRHAVRGAEITIGLELTALTFAERFADSIATGDWSTLCAWVDEVCEKYAELPVIARLLRAGPAVAQNVVRDLAGGSALASSELAGIADQIERIAARPRVPASLVATDALDEIDVVLGELVSRLETADPLTAEHSRAVGVWCGRISRQMSLSRSETVFVSRCGLIHDIGKMTTPPEILTAPRRLTGPEMNIMRRHAEDGAAIIAAIPLLAHHTPAVRGHHERLDGRGYPDGLGTSRIPLAARIVAVADSFNAMIGNRPYRLPMRPTAALLELGRHSGTQFDPEVIEAMNDVLHRSTAVSPLRQARLDR